MSDGITITRHRYYTFNSNGRMYDPNLGRFISVDPYVQEPANLQNYNRYSYCLNNPLKYTDPSGEFFLCTIIACVVDFVKTAFFEGGLDFTSPGAMSDAWEDFDPTAPWSMTNKSWKMSVGLYITDGSRNFIDRAWELMCRFVDPLTYVGSIVNQVHNFSAMFDKNNHRDTYTEIEANRRALWYFIENVDSFMIIENNRYQGNNWKWQPNPLERDKDKSGRYKNYYEF